MPTVSAGRRYKRGGVLTRPNVLWFVTDDQPADTVTPEVMPYLTSNPEGAWVTFPYSVETTPLCAIIRATFFTGQRWQRHGVKDNNEAPNLNESSTIATVAAAAGYRTGLLGKYENDWPQAFGNGSPYVPPGWEVFFGRTGNEAAYYDWGAYTNLPGVPTDYGFDPEDYHTDVLADLADDFIRAADSRPWFCYVAPAAPHEESIPAPRHADLTYPAIPDPPDFNQADLSAYPGYLRNRPVMTSTQEDACRTNRIEERKTLRSVDEMIERCIDALKDTGQLDNTVVIFCTDNSAMMGRKRWSIENSPGGFEKKVPYQGSVSALLRVRYPGAPTRDEMAPVATVDVPCSIASWMGGVWQHTVDGSPNLARVLLDEPGAVKRTAAESTYPESGGIPTWHSIITADGFKYIEYRFGTVKGTVPGTIGATEVYNLNTDPYEMTNLHGQNPTRDAAQKALLDQHIANPLFWEV